MHTDFPKLAISPPVIDSTKNSSSESADSNVLTNHECWLDGFLQQASSTPSRRAVTCGDKTLTYGELSALADRIASHLVEIGIGKGDFVGLGLNRSLNLPAALLGILKSGAAYVPIDPSYPAKRIQSMIASAGLNYIVTSKKLADHFSGLRTICIDDDSLLSAATTSFESEIGKDDLIYAIFTSGSTGQPKAASVYHRSFGNLLQWYTQELKIGSDDRSLIITSPSFDLTQKNFFAPIITGGSLVLDECQTYDITRISKLIRDHQVTLLNCTPSAFYPLLDADAKNGFSTFSSLRFVILGGEPISIPRIRSWLENSNCHAEIVNSYGPTECTDICAYHRIHSKNIDEYAFVPLGLEIPNVKIKIVDSTLELLPDGELGELCIVGAGLGAGYLNDPKRTEEVFTKSLYRTGDLARRMPSGLIEFRGRADHQVKINGFRIELGEIELTINQHPDVSESAVITEQDRLIAYIKGGTNPNELKKFLATRLPSYMVPNEIIKIDQFPLTPNGKMDRKALAETTQGSKESIDQNTSIEAKILAIWSDMLNRSITDPRANFFDLGGSSIHLAIMHVKLMEMAATEFPITTLFALPNARAIADFLSSKNKDSNSTIQARAQRSHTSFSQFRKFTTPR